MFEDIFDESDGCSTVVFLLTELKSGDVKAEVIPNADDVRIKSRPKRALALIAIDHFRFAHEDMSGSHYVSGVGMAFVFKPRIYERLTAVVGDFFDALADVSKDVTLLCRCEDDDNDGANEECDSGSPFYWEVVYPCANGPETPALDR